MARIILCILCFCLTQAGWSQKATIQGRVMDTSRSALAETTISLLHAADSSMAEFTFTNKDGSFNFQRINKGNYLLLITHSGHQPLFKNIEVKDINSVMDLGILQISPSIHTLEEVVVTDLAPVKIKGDTISFRADAFKTKPNATVEDLLKKLPGMEVQRDGTVKAMGEQVQKVYVDGKEFFGNDPKLATKNITADMVDQVQVYDDMSEQARFSRIDDGSRTKTINIKLKKDRNKGYFGMAELGAGNRERYEGKLSFNHFRGDRRLSALGTANNTNNTGFSFSDIISSMGGLGALMKMGGREGGLDGARAMSGNRDLGIGNDGGGISSSASGGINYNNAWKRVDFRGSYYYSSLNTVREQYNFRNEFFPLDSTSETSLVKNGNDRNRNHRFNVRWEYQVDSVNSFLYTAAINLQHSEGNQDDSSFTYSRAVLDYLAITGRTATANERDGLQYNGELLYRRRFSKPGRTLTVGWKNGFNETEGEQFNRSPYSFYKPDGDLAAIRNLDYVSGQATRANSNTLSSSFTEGIGKNKIIEINYAYSQVNSTSDKRTFDFNHFTGKYDILNSPQTNFFENTQLNHRLGMNYREQYKKYNFQLGAGLQLSSLESHSIQAATGRDTIFRQEFINFFPQASLNFTFSKAKNLKFNYRGRTQAPGIAQLQDVPDLSNPLQVRIGNPDLAQEFHHSFQAFYYSFQLLKFRFFAANLGVNASSNRIVYSIDSLSKTVTIARPVNMDGTYSLNGFTSLGMPVKKWKGVNLMFSSLAAYTHDKALLYGKENRSNMLLLTQQAGINYDYKEKLVLGFRASFTYNRLQYELQPLLNARYFTQVYTTELSYSFTERVILETDLDYNIYSGREEEFNRSVPVWNASLRHLFLKDKSLTLRFAVNDIMNQNRQFNRLTGQNYWEDNRSLVLQRYFLVSLGYRLNKMGNKPGGMEKMLEKGIRFFRN